MLDSYKAKNKYNKYQVKLEKYISDKKLNNGVVYLKYCANLKMKADELERKKSLALYNYVNRIGKVDLKKVTSLIESGANINAKFQDGVTLYMIAALNCQIEVLDLLKNQGADIYAKTTFGQDALMLANLMKHTSNYSAKRVYLEVIRTLQNHGLGKSLEVDNVGLTRDDYYLGNTDPFTNFYLKLIQKYMHEKTDGYVYTK